VDCAQIIDLREAEILTGLLSGCCQPLVKGSVIVSARWPLT